MVGFDLQVLQRSSPRLALNNGVPAQLRPGPVAPRPSCAQTQLRPGPLAPSPLAPATDRPKYGENFHFANVIFVVRNNRMNTPSYF